ncbi:hypothetical protein ONE63_009597 [Megalurothrips usitatus]|uniref:JmjC domain-containing protein n=1 Tax=Megalurothrips usitatus TaxID=439358 RepID=A0AAV7XK51_9NEOP|nr:hypothetical protein ONE63_009597 [Megalurothrips usitatus]
MNKKFNEKEYDTKEKRQVFSYQPDSQMVFKASLKDAIYEYVRAECTAEERAKFVEETLNPESYTKLQPNCCHFFEVLDQTAQFNENLEQIIKEKGENVKSPTKSTPLVYGTGIQLDRRQSYKICSTFSLSKLNTVLDLVDEKYDGLVYPYVYAASLHTFFAWHIEVAGTWSINYLLKGSPKPWFVIPPQFYGLVDKVSSTFRLNKYHTSCRAVLVDHKVIVTDPEYFKQHYGVPYATVVQEPGDFVITFPFSLHSGFNCGKNLAIAANFGDPDWAALGIYTPNCMCNEDQVNLDFTNILKKCRPDLLDVYKTGTALVFPVGHPLEVVGCSLTTPIQSSKVSDARGSSKDKSTSSHEVQNHRGIKGRILHCPECNVSFKENEMQRLKCHIMKHHSEKADRLLRVVAAKYPPWKPKTTGGFRCKVCSVFMRGSKTHLSMHYKKLHPGVTFPG